MSADGDIPNGPGAAAILAAGLGSLTLGIIGFAEDAVPALKPFVSLWPPSGPLSGVSTAAVAVWLIAWLMLGRRWARREVKLAAVNLAAFLMLGAALLLTFPPFVDLLQGR